MEQQTRSQIYKVIPIPGIKNFLTYLSDGEVTRDLIQATVDKKHIGQTYETWGSPGAVGNTIVALLEYSKRWFKLKEDHKLSWRAEGNEVIVMWNGLPLGKAIVHKKKGKYHHMYYGHSYYDWEISSIEIIDFEDINARVNEIICIEARSKAAAEQRVIEGCNMVKAIQALFPNETEWGIRSKIDWLQKNQYKVFDYMKKEVQG